ncbi:MAG: efflux RND transporter periplasmic adaptor subunit [Pseudomonadota bacterium]
MASTTSSPSVMKRALRRLSIITTTLIVFGVAVGAIILATSTISDRAAAVPGVTPAPVVSIAVSKIAFQDSYSVQRRFVGQVEPLQRTSIAFEQGGTLVSVSVDEGDTVKKDTVLATLDTRLLEAERSRLTASKRALQAQADLLKRTADRQTKLQNRGFASNQAMDQAVFGLAEVNARLAEIDAGLVANSIQLEKAVIRAPFSGRVAQRFLDAGATAAAGAPVVSLLQNADAQFRVGITPSLVASLSKDQIFEVNFGTEQLKAKLISISPDVIATTRTQIVRFELEDGGNSLFGQTGTLVLSQRIAQSGAMVPISALEEGVRGLWSIKTVVQRADNSTVVGKEAVEIVHATEDAAFVRGTFGDGARFITDGPHQVTVGQRISIVGAEPSNGAKASN